MKQWVAVSELSKVYEVESCFFDELVEYELIEIRIYEEEPSIEYESLKKLELILSLSHELKVNLEGVDIVLNLIEKIESLKDEVKTLKNKLELFEK